MKNQTHVNVTVNFAQIGGRAYDLRIPVHQPVRHLLLNLADTMGMQTKQPLTALKVINKQLVLADDDRLEDFPVTDGDILLVLAEAQTQKQA